MGIPRAASVPFEMAVAPYLPKEASVTICMVIFSLVFFVLAAWLAMTPNKLVERIGKFLTPTLLLLLVFVFINYVFRGEVNIAAAQEAYAGNPLAKGFLEGYQTMDTIAALNFGLVIATTITSLGIESKKSVMSYTVRAGIFAGTILSLVYLMLSYMGMGSSNVFPIQEKWCLDSSLHCKTVVWRSGSSASGSDFYAGMSDNLCGTDYFYFPVFFHTYKEDFLYTVGIFNFRFFIPCM